MLDVSSHLTSLGAPLAFLLVVAVVFAETGLLVGFVLPGDSLLFSVGVLLATGVLRVPFALMAAGVVLAAFAGDQVGYALGRMGGTRLRERGSRLVGDDPLDRAHAFFVAHGARSVVLARFVAVVRTLTPTVAGMAGMPYRRFALFDALGCAAWALAMLGAGRLLGTVPVVADHTGLLGIGVVAVVAVSLLVPVLRARLRGRRPPASRS